MEKLHPVTEKVNEDKWEWTGTEKNSREPLSSARESKTNA